VISPYTHSNGASERKKGRAELPKNKSKEIQILGEEASMVAYGTALANLPGWARSLERRPTSFPLPRSSVYTKREEID